MPTELLDVTVRDGAESFQHLVNRRSASELTVEEMEEHVAVARIYTRVFRSMWEEVRVRLDEGVEDKTIRVSCAALDAAIASWRKAVDTVEAWGTRAAGGAGPTIRGLAELAGEATWARAVQAAARGLVEMADTPRLPPDPKRVEAAIAEGRYKNIKDILKTRRAREAS